MKFSTIATLAGLVFVQYAAAQIPNSNFESWSGSPLSPAGWLVSNSPQITTVTPTVDMHSLAFAARGEVVTIAHGVNYPPSMYAGSDGSGFPLTWRPEALRGWYKFTAVGGDALIITSIFRQGRTTLGQGRFTALATQSVYREFVANTTWISSAVPDTGMITVNVTGSGGEWHLGTSFVLDELSYGAATDVKENAAAVPVVVALEQNFPNPFNPKTKIQFQIPQDAVVTLTVYNLLGQEVARLVHEQLPAGKYRVDFDGATLSSGTYLYRLHAGNSVLTRKLTLIK